jgi:hypothetical protein
VIEALRELVISLENFKSYLVSPIEATVTSTSLQRMWENKAECFCRGMLNQAEKLMEESGMERHHKDQLDPLMTTLERIVELAQLVEGFELEPFEAS